MFDLSVARIISQNTGSFLPVVGEICASISVGFAPVVVGLLFWGMWRRTKKDMRLMKTTGHEGQSVKNYGDKR